MNSQWTVRVIMGLLLERRLLVAGITLALLFAAVASTFLLPREYESETRVLVLDNHALRSLHGLEAPGQADAPEVNRLISEGFRSRAAVENVVAALGLVQPAKDRSAEEQVRFRENLISSIRSSIQVDLLETGPGRSIFRIAYRSPDPAQAQRVVTQLAAGTSAWLRSEVMITEDLALEPARAQAAAARQEFRGVADRLAALEAESPDISSATADPSADEQKPERERLLVVEAATAALELRLADLRAQLAEEPEWRTGAGMEPVRNETHLELAQSVDRVDSELADLKLQHRTIVEALRIAEDRQVVQSRRRGEWAALVAEQDRLLQQLREAEQQELAALTEVLSRAAGAPVIVDVLDPPAYPMEPDVEHPLVIAALGLVLGLGAGSCTVLTLDFLNKSARTPAEVEQLLELPVLGAVSRIETAGERKLARRRARAATAGILALLFLTALALFVQASSGGDVAALMARVNGILR
jgi:capsular polysaccharide biosynthesis protein